MLGKLLNFARRTKSQYVDDTVVEAFERVFNQVITDPDSAGQHLDELAKIMGSDGPEPAVGPMPEYLKPK